MNELVKVDMSQYGLEESKAAEVKKDFDAVLKIAVELEDSFNEIIAKPLALELCAEAKALRLKYVKVRTAIAAVHKERKAFYLSGGRAIDGLKNAYTHAVEGNEARLEAIEKHFENIELERIAKLQSERMAECAKYEIDAALMSLGSMTADVWTNYIAGVELQYKARKDAEAKAESDRIDREKAEAEERELIRIENVRLKAEADERERAAKIESDKRAAEEKERLKKEAAERAERQRIEEERQLAEQAERDRIAAEREKERKDAEAKLQAERDERERIERAQAEKEAAERKAKAEAEARENDTENKKRVNNAAVGCLVKAGLTESDAKTAIIAIASGKVNSVKIVY